VTRCLHVHARTLARAAARRKTSQLALRQSGSRDRRGDPRDTIDITTTGRRVLAVFVEEFNRRHGPDSPWPHAVLNEWLERSPLAKVTFADAE